MIRIGIYGYGNLGRGVEAAIKKNSDMELVAVFTRRNPNDLKINTDSAIVIGADDVLDYKDKIDVMVLCGGSATDLPKQTPYLAKYFNVVDSFDNHSKVYEHYLACNEAALPNKKVAVISTGWDPGMFSLNRAIMASVLPDGKDYTFWGKGVSQGHSDAIRRIEGVIDARQYTIPVDSALESVRNGENPTLTTRQKHTRECFVVVSDPSYEESVERQIKQMPGYFLDYDTTVHFITLDELKKNHSGIPHGGFVIRSGETSDNTKHVIEYSLKLDSNPEFTGSVLACYARAAYNLSKKCDYGCKTVFDIAPRDLYNDSYEEMLKHIL